MAVQVQNIPPATSPSVNDWHFLDWCLHRKELPASTRWTVERLLGAVNAEDCYEGDRQLAALTKLDLDGSIYYGNAWNDIEDRDSLFLTDLRPLQSLTQLRELDLSDNHIADLSPLAALPHLQTLNLSFNQISDLQPLSNLTQLQRLDLSLNQIADVRSLQTLTNLVELNLSHNQIQDLAPLGTLHRLNHLQLSGNAIAPQICPVKPATICSF